MQREKSIARVWRNNGRMASAAAKIMAYQAAAWQAARGKAAQKRKITASIIA